MFMVNIEMGANSQKQIKIAPGKVGFLWQAESERPITCAVDGIPIACGNYKPPFVVKEDIMFISKERTKIQYNMETYDDIYVPQAKNREYEPMVQKTEETRPTIPHITNVTLTEADKWYEIRVPPDMVTWQIRARGDIEMRYAFEPSHTTYMTLPAGEVLTEDTAPNMSIRAIYVSCSTANTIVEFELWRYKEDGSG